MLDEAALINKGQECFLRGEVVFPTVLLTSTRFPSSVCEFGSLGAYMTGLNGWGWQARGVALTGDGEAEGIGVVGKEALEDGRLATSRGAGDDDRSTFLRS